MALKLFLTENESHILFGFTCNNSFVIWNFWLSSGTGDSTWIHLDIAGPAYVTTKYNYRGKGATGMGVRLLYNYVKEY